MSHITSGTSTFSSSRNCCLNLAAYWASQLKSSSFIRTFLHSFAIATQFLPRLQFLFLCNNPAICCIISKSIMNKSFKLGLWTLNTTSFPFFNFPLWTWANEADPTGWYIIWSISENFFPNSCEIVASTCLNENGGTWSCNLDNSLIHVLGIKSGLADNNCPILIKAEPSLINSLVSHLARFIWILFFISLLVLRNVKIILSNHKLNKSKKSVFHIRQPLLNFLIRFPKKLFLIKLTC